MIIRYLVFNNIKNEGGVELRKYVFEIRMFNCLIFYLSVNSFKFRFFLLVFLFV